MTYQSSEVKIEDILYEFALAKEIPDAQLLDEFARRYPAYATEITDFAVELVLDIEDELSKKVEPITENGFQSSLITRVMSRFQNELFSLDQDKSVSEGSKLLSTRVANPFSCLSRESFRALAVSLGVNNVFLTRLRDRLIVPTTIPEQFLRKVAEKLQIEVQVLVSHFSAAPEVRCGAQYFAAKERPHVVTQQTFEEAISNSGLNEEQMKCLLKTKEKL